MNYERDENERIIYFAGSVSFGGGYRGLLFHGRVMSEEYHLVAAMKNTTLNIVYGGPTAIGCDHGCYHGAATHGAGEGCSCSDSPANIMSSLGRGYLINRCLDQIRTADGVFAYIQSLDCFGTLAEIGYASAYKKPIQIIIDEALRPLIEVECSSFNAYGEEGIEIEPRNELWFVLNLPGVRWRYGLVPDFDETVFSRKCDENLLVPAAHLLRFSEEVSRLKKALSFIEKETCRIADKGSAMWRELLTAVIVKPIREVLDK